MIVVLDTLVISFWLGRSSIPVSRVFFNVAAAAVAIWIASSAFYFATRIEPLSITPQPVLTVALPLFGLAALYFLLNSWLVAFAVSFQKGQRAFLIWKQNFLWLSLNYFSGASVAALLLPYLLQANTYDAFLYVTGVLLPVLLIFYLTFKAALGRVDDANRHLNELNKLYLSTIETLAMAIDAKDQITHGHIRRVQQYAVQLAKHIGITEQAQISAIEAASLLHDMGKLAVPEYILNKPGKLTAAEFEKMKLHASVGADILSAIDFPYPVVPIVRHHHENWDGTGYPDGLKGAEIPIGARILSVVDCFDALTSDRPYRPRLSDVDAIDILVDRRGAMYDPIIVDAFIEVHARIREEFGPAENTGLTVPSTSRGGNAVEQIGRTARLNDIAASTEEMMALYDLAIALSTKVDVPGMIEEVFTHVRRLVPATTCVFYKYDSASDDLLAEQANGEYSAHFLGLRIRRGERLTGWVAANKRTIVNSDPVLDLGDIGRRLRPLQNCLSTPLVSGDDLIGVLTLYSTSEAGFGEDHRRIVESIVKQLTPRVKTVLATDSKAPGGAGQRHLQHAFAASDFAPASDVSIIVVTIRGEHRNEGSGDSSTDAYFERVAESIKKGLRTADLLLRHKAEQFLVLLPQTGLSDALGVATRVSVLLSEDFAVDLARHLELVMGVASAPTDGSSLEVLMRSAIKREQPIVPEPPNSLIH
jgi:diguanylate cyclase (GGDEF)-like protein/putative nucleotidyltransferase with HDIG domain